MLSPLSFSGERIKAKKVETFQLPIQSAFYYAFLSLSSLHTPASRTTYGWNVKTQVRCPSSETLETMCF